MGASGCDRLYTWTNQGRFYIRSSWCVIFVQPQRIAASSLQLLVRDVLEAATPINAVQKLEWGHDFATIDGPISLNLAPSGSTFESIK